MDTEPVERLHGALPSGDAAALAPDAALHVPGDHHLAGSHRAVLDDPTVHLLRVDGGRVAEIRSHHRDQRPVDAVRGTRRPR